MESRYLSVKMTVSMSLHLIKPILGVFRHTDMNITSGWIRNLLFHMNRICFVALNTFYFEFF
jgi:hypothetical protein